MNVLVLKPGLQSLAFTCFCNGWDQPLCAGQLDDYRSPRGSQSALAEIRRLVTAAAAARDLPASPDVIAVRGVFGGSAFRGPVLVSSKVVRRLEKLVPQAPLHIPPMLALIKACEESSKKTPMVLVFETSFFVDLPEREYLYAVASNLTRPGGVRRFGYHGILHAAASETVAHQRRARGLEAPARLLSICLEARPEVAAVLGHKPVLVTSGATPLEGLPGQTTCGELDPSIVLMLAQKKGWGPEQINAVLTQESGWLGLMGRRATLGEIFVSRQPECELARKVIQYRLLQVCGAGMAALGGVDDIVFSGRCSGVGVGLGLWLKKKLTFDPKARRNPITVEICSQTVERLLGETACATLMATSGSSPLSDPLSPPLPRLPEPVCATPRAESLAHAI